VSYDRYAYALNSPIRYNDPTGHCVACIGFLGGVIGGAIYGYGSQVINNVNQGMGFGQAMTTNISGESVMFYTAVGAVIGTGVGPAVAPIASAIVSATSAGGAVTTVAGGAEIANIACGRDACADEVQSATQVIQESGPELARTLGKAGETASGIIKNTKHIPSLSNTAAYRIPDQWLEDPKLISEVKNVTKLSLTNQLKDFVAFAQKEEYTFELWMRETTNISQPLQELIDNGQIIPKYLESQ
jgi:hypothetical protein